MQFHIPPRRLAQTLAVGCLVIGLLGSNPFAQELRSPEFMSKARAGFDAIYNLDYEQATQDLIRLRQEFPQHPAPPLYLATVRWLRELFQREELELDHFVAPGYFDKKTDREMPEADRKAFFEYIDESQALSQAILEKDPTSKDARYFLGASYGIQGSFAVTVDRSVKQAFSHGKKAYALHRQLVDEDPEYFDAYMSVGLYEYIVGNLPWYIKWLAAIVGYRGSEKQGFEYLNLAALNGNYVKDDARTLQMVLYIREKRPLAALTNARMLHGKYPRNYLLHINQAQILEMMEQKDDAIRTYREVLERAENGRRNYQKLPVADFRLKAAERFEEMERPEEALAEYARLTSNTSTPDKQRALAHLNTALIYERRNSYPQAIEHYRSVLDIPPYGSTHIVAERRLKKLKKYASDDQSRGN